MTNTGIYPKVSIIMPTWNRAEFIVETIESVRNQTYQNWELIIVDDGSDDNTEALIAAIPDKRIKFYNEVHAGIRGKVYNNGLEKSTGELIAFLDSDDLWASAKLEKQVDALQQYPGAGFSLTGGYNFRKLNEPLAYFYKQREGIKYDNIFISFFKSEVAAVNPALMFRKECLATTGNLNDADTLFKINFILSLARHFKAVILYEPLFFRRLHDSNYSDLNRVKRHYDGIEMIRSYKKALPSNVFRDALFRSQIHFGEKCLQDKQRKKAIRQFFKAWINKPFSIVPLKKIIKAALLSSKK